MLDILDAYTADLGATRHYGKRRCCWIPASVTHPEYDGRLGNLTTVLQPARTGWGRKIEVDTYFVAEEPCVGEMGRRFHLANATKDDKAEVYECVVGPHPRCTCKATRCKVTDDDGKLVCKHYSALAELVRQGVV